MHPVLIKLGSFELHTYGILGAVGFLLGCFVAIRHARRVGWDVDALVDVIFWASVSAIVGSRALWLFQNPGHFQGPLDLIDLRRGGLVFYGAFVGLPVAWAVARRRGLPWWEVLDVFGRVLPMSHGVSRLGCLAAGCCYGLPTDLPWGVVYPPHVDSMPGLAPAGVALHPTPIYEAIGLFVLAAGLTWLDGRKRFAGQTMLSYVLGYAALRSVTELFRGDADRYFVWPSVLGDTVSTSQAVSLGVALCAGLLWWRLSSRARASTSTTPPPAATP